jgi:hypothetical protein
MRHRLVTSALLALVLVGSSTGYALADGDDHPVYPLDTHPPTENDNAVLKWNEEALQCIRVTKPGPTIVARALAILHMSTYNAWSAYDAKAVPTIRTGWTRRPSSQRTVANKSQAVSHAAYIALNDLFPDCRAAFTQRLSSMGYSASDSSTAAADGRNAGQRVVAARRNDGANQHGDHPNTPAHLRGVRYADYTGYTPVNTADSNTNAWRWQPLRVPLPNGVPQTPLTPQWGRVKSFDSNLNATALQAPNPLELDASKRNAMMAELLEDSSDLTDRQKVIAEYWADGPRSELPPGHWNLLAQWVSRRWRQSIDQDAKMFFGLNGAMLDASIGAWELKYRYDFARPITAVRALRAAQTVPGWGGPVLGAGWVPYQPADFPTPPFPAYPSGHSTFSAAAAAFLKDFGALAGRDGDVFGASVTIDEFRAEPGVKPAAPVTLSWPSFTAAANEAGMSRRHGGIHWDIDDIPARDLGKKIGETCFSTAKKYWEGG